MGASGGSLILAPENFKRSIAMLADSKYDAVPSHNINGDLHIKDENDIVGIMNPEGQISVFYTSHPEGAVKSYSFSRYLGLKGVNPKEHIFAGTEGTKRMLLGNLETLTAQIVSSRNQLRDTQ